MTIDTATKFIQTYDFDDLLVNCTKEIMTNGLNTNSIPSPIKDWLCGKILSSLPEVLVSKLFGFMLENKTISDHVSFRQCANSQKEEITLILYQNPASKKKIEENKKIQEQMAKNPNFLYDDTDNQDVFLSGNSSDVRETPQYNNNYLNDKDSLLKAHLSGGVLNTVIHGFHAEEFIVHNLTEKAVHTNATIATLANYKKGRNVDPITSASQANLLGQHGLKLAANKNNNNEEKNKSRNSNNLKRKNEQINGLKSELSKIDNKSKRQKSGASNVTSDFESSDFNPELDLALSDDTGTEAGYKTRSRTTIHSNSKYVKATEHLLQDSRKAQMYETKQGPWGSDFDIVPWELGKIDEDLKESDWQLGKNRFKCPVCKERNEVTYHSKYALTAHLRDKHINYWKSNKHQYVLVRGSFEQQAKMMPEVVIDPDSLRYTCKICDKQWDKATGVVKHVNRVHRRCIEATCEFCGKEFNNIANYRIHRMTHTGEYSHYCEYCGKGVRKLQKLREHKKANHRELYELELKEKRDKKNAEERLINEALESGDFVLEQRVDLNEEQIQDIVERVCQDGRDASNLPEMNFVFQI